MIPTDQDEVTVAALDAIDAYCEALSPIQQRNPPLAFAQRAAIDLLRLSRALRAVMEEHAYYRQGLERIWRLSDLTLEPGKDDVAKLQAVAHDYLISHRPRKFDGIERRLLDLVRYCRHYLLDKKLITLEEFSALVGVGAESAKRLAGYDALRQRVAELEAERDALGTAIAKAAIKAGIIDGDVALTGPQLIMLCQDLAVAATTKEAADETYN